MTPSSHLTVGRGAARSEPGHDKPGQRVSLGVTGAHGSNGIEEEGVTTF